MIQSSLGCIFPVQWYLQNHSFFVHRKKNMWQNANTGKCSCQGYFVLLRFIYQFAFHILLDIPMLSDRPESVFHELSVSFDIFIYYVRVWNHYIKQYVHCWSFTAILIHQNNGAYMYVKMLCFCHFNFTFHCIQINKCYTHGLSQLNIVILIL